MAIGRPTLVLAFFVFVLTFCTVLWWDRILGALAPSLPLTDGGTMVFSPMTARVETTMADIGKPPKPPTPPPAGVDPRLADGNNAMIATFDTNRGTHVHCRLSYAGAAADTWVIEYTDKRWAERSSGAKQWQRSGCDAAVKATGEIVPMMIAFDRANATIPDTPEYAKEKSDRKTISELTRQMQAGQLPGQN